MTSDRVPDLLKRLLRDKIIYVKKRRFTGNNNKKENFKERISAADQLETALKLGMFNYRRNRWKFEIVTEFVPEGTYTSRITPSSIQIQGKSGNLLIQDEILSIQTT